MSAANSSAIVESCSFSLTVSKMNIEVKCKWGESYKQYIQIRFHFIPYISHKILKSNENVHCYAILRVSTYPNNRLQKDFSFALTILCIQLLQFATVHIRLLDYYHRVSVCMFTNVNAFEKHQRVRGQRTKQRKKKKKRK